MADKLTPVGDGVSFRLLREIGGGATAEVVVVAGGGVSKVIIAGEYKFGKTLTASPAPGWSWAAGKWVRNGVDISGATALTYQMGQADIGAEIGFVPTNPVEVSVVQKCTADVPGAPTIGVATAGNATVTLSATAPASNGGSAIIGYRGRLSDGSIATSASLPVVFNGVKNGFIYTGVVEALNGIGYGPASAESNAVMPSDSVFSSKTTMLAALMPTTVSAPFTGSHNLMMSMPGDFDAVAAVAINFDTTAPYVIDNTAYAVSERSDTSKTVPIINGTQYNVSAANGTQLGFIAGTWNNGSASVSVPAAKLADSGSGVVIPTFAIGDFVQLSSIPRVDNPAGFPLLICRQFWNARAISQFSFANATDVDALNTAMAPYEFYQTAQGTTNGVTTPSAFSSNWASGASTLSGRILCLAVRLRGTGQLILVGGDSIHQGVAADGSTNPNKPLNNWGGFQALNAKALASKVRPVGYVNIAFSGMRSVDFHERMQAAIPVLHPTIVSSPVFTPNDTGQGTDATFDTQLARALTLKGFAEQNGVKPVFLTGTPGGGASYAQQLAFTNRLKASALAPNVIDVFTPIADAANATHPGWLESAYYDGTHPSPAGHARMASVEVTPKYVALIGQG